MIRFLASVRSAEEAAIALAGGADIIDAKEPRTGALGRVGPAALAGILREVAGRRPVSATIGDLPLEPQTVADAVEAMAASGVDIVKIGFFPGPLEPTLAALQPMVRSGARLVAVTFADRRPELGRIVRNCADAGFYGVMLDTAEKAGGNLTAHLGLGALQEFVTESRALGLLTGLAGSLRIGDIPALASCGADYLGFRSALTAGSRNDAVDPAAVRIVRRALDQASPESSRAIATEGAMSAAAGPSSGVASGTRVSNAK
jgi:dihydroneopterin aldolase